MVFWMVLTEKQIVKRVDARGLNCPLPLLKAKQALNAVNSGERIEIVATDQGSWRDIRAFAEQSGHLLVEAEDESSVYRYCLQKK
jgi:TusA-related sulfurtransferase